MNKRFTSFLFCLVGVSAPTMCPAQGNPGSHAIVLSRTGAPVELSALSVKSFYLPLRCDNRGTIYVQLYNGGRPEPEVTSISADGKIVRFFNLKGDPDLSSSTMSDFTLINGNSLAIPVSRNGKSFLVTFRDSGEIATQVHLEDDFWVNHAGAFGTGGWLIIGRKSIPDDSAGQGVQSAEIAAYGSRGERLSAHLQDELVSSLAVERSEEGMEGERISVSGEHLSKEAERLYFSQLESAPNGNVYLLEPGNPATIKEIGPDGHNVRVIVLPTPAVGMKPAGMFFAGHEVAVDFHVSLPGGNEAIAVFDRETARLKQTYTVPANMPGTLGCFDAGSFTFISNTDHWGILQHAAR